jgi:pectate lyase
MKKTYFKFIVAICLLNFIFGNSHLKSQQPVYYFPVPEGYGAGITGGGNTPPVTVSTYADLKTQLTSSGPKVILVSGTITIPSGGEISGNIVNKTLLGLPGAHLVNNNQTASTSGILLLGSSSDNVIIRNILFEGPGAYDVDGNDNLSVQGTRFWIDHCEFQDGMDGNCDITKMADYGTVSWCKVTYLKPPKAGGSGGSNDHRFSGLVGSSGTSVNASGHYHITFQCNYWAAGCVERMPRARNCQLHIVNCYYNTAGTGSYAIGVGGGINNSTVYTENCDFADVASVFRSFDTTDGGSESVTFVNCLKGVANVGSAVQKPTYSYTVFPVENVANYVGNTSCGAGTTLQVTTSGAISSNCGTTETRNTLTDSDVKLFSSVIDHTLDITFVKGDTNTDLSIFSLSGQRVFTKSMDITFNRSIELDLSNLKSGIYFCNIQNRSTSTTLRFIKK